MLHPPVVLLLRLCVAAWLTLLASAISRSEVDGRSEVNSRSVVEH